MKPGDLIKAPRSKTVWTVLQVYRSGLVLARRQSTNKDNKGAWIEKMIKRPELYRRVKL